ncbi:Putative niacin/nicotinamide transporter NaiP [Corynebacterium urogenitale]|uniref:Niacin/nicotinamide transporter NaiP n=1 Tax=Corynebacterium urogenitale TaxID=2487892 RepID=A0A5J6Z6E0_9CORY|nr:MFS transporter [Corynebacterium urogenitale]QFQ01782.1 Putative niacin/nicotinamide transporter NaiP [Corynebacterium urogenitale]
MIHSSQPSATPTRNQRLDQLPLTRKHGKLLGASGIGWAMDAMDVGLISFIMAALTAHWGLNATQTSWLASIGFLGMALGAALGGLLADKFGRRQIFAATLLIYGLATGASALAGSLAVLMIFRFIVGLGLGAELPVASTLISEFSPRTVRGRMVVLLEAFWAIGWILAAIIGTFVVSASDNGWRWALALGCIPALYSVVVRWGMPESVRYLESRGRHEEAESAVRSFENSPPLASNKITRQGDNPAQQTHTGHDKGIETAHGIWDRLLAKRTAALWIVWFCINFSYYGAFIWIPSLLHAQGYTLVKSFTFTLIITLAQLPGYAVAAYLIERWGRRNTLATFLAGSALSAAAYGFASSDWQIIVAGCFLSFFNLGAWGALYAIGPELYPTTLRGTGTGAAAGFGRVASILAPLAVPPLLALGGTNLLFAVFGTAFAAAALAAYTLPEQKGKVLAN